MKRKLWFTTAAAATVAAAGLVFFSLTPEGTALADRVVKFFAPQKQLDTQIEGGTETQQAALFTNKHGEVGYVIYIDTERYGKQSNGGVDYYKALNQPEGYPPVQMEISQVMGTDAQQEYQKLLSDAKSGFDVAEGLGQVTEPVKSWAILAYDEEGSDAPYENIYVVDNTKGGCFVIRCRMFREAAEGHGARFLEMLKTFEVVRSSQMESAMPQTPAPTPAPTAELKPTKLTWDNLMIFGAKLDTNGFEAINALTDAIGSQPVRDDTVISGGGKTRTVAWADGTIAVLRNADLYSIETTNSNASVVGLHPGMTLDQFKAVLGEPHEGINGTLAWGVGSNDNLIITLADGAVTSIKISLVE